MKDYEIDALTKTLNLHAEKYIYYVNESALDITKYTLENFCEAFNDEAYAEISDSNYIYLTKKDAEKKLKKLTT
jgi:hypothetical protein